MMEDNSHIVKALENVFDASDTALRRAEDSLKASRNALTQTKLLFESIKDFNTESGSAKICYNCHSEECKGRFDKCLCLRIIWITYYPKHRF